MKRLLWLPAALFLVSLCCLGVLLAAPISARADVLPRSTPDQQVWITNGPVDATAIGPDGTTYIGGRFTYVGPYTGGGVAFDLAGGASDASFPLINGAVSATVPDGAGGYYIGGGFTKVGGLTRSRIAHILADGSVDPAFHPNANGTVSVLAVSGSTVYAGGSFTSVGGETRHYLAALVATNGAVKAWNPDASGGEDGAAVLALAVSGSTVYAGGWFTAIGGQTRKHIAALNVTTGAARGWDPKANGEVYTLAVSGSTVYAGGNFWSIGGQARNNIAALDAGSGAATAWNPDANPDDPEMGVVRTLAVSGSTVYAGGYFTSIGGQPRNSIAALDAGNGFATAWDPNATDNARAGGIYTLAVSGSTVYVGGKFTSIGGQPRNRIAALDTSSGAATGWSLSASGGLGNGDVRTLAISGSTVCVGGSFNSIGGQTRSGIAALDASTGAATGWNPNVSPSPSYDSVDKIWDGGDVRALAISGSTVYAGGSFTAIGGQPRIDIAALDASSGAATAWDPDTDGADGSSVNALAVSGSIVYASGAFAHLRSHTGSAAALDATSGAPDTPFALVNGPVYATVSDGVGGYYIGGEFTLVGGLTRNRVAHVLADGSVDPSFDSNANGEVDALAVSGSTVYAGGYFTSIGGQSRSCIAALEASSGLATAWDPGANGYVWALAVSGSTVYAGGYFTSIGGQPRNHIAALDAGSGAATAWDPNTGPGGYGWVNALAVSGSTVYAGGYFTSIGGQPRNRIAALDAGSGAATAWNPSASYDNPAAPRTTCGVCALAVSGSTVYAGGTFTLIGGQPRNHIAALDATTGTATSWNPYAGGATYTSVLALAVSGSTVYAGGNFLSIGGQTRNNIAALDAGSGAATAWDPDADGRVKALAVAGSTVYVGGEFTGIVGQPHYIAALDAGSGAATVWNPAIGYVNALAVSGSTVYACGANYIAALDAGSGAATFWDTNASPSPNYDSDDPKDVGADVRALAVSGSTVYAAGYFTAVGGKTRNSIAALDASTGAVTPWNPNESLPADHEGFLFGCVRAIAVSGSTVYVGGSFDFVGGKTRNCIAALGASSGAVTAWDPNASGRVSALAVSGSTVYAGGTFTTIGGQARSCLARFSPPPETTPPTTTDDSDTLWHNSGVTVTLTPTDNPGGSGMSGGQAKTEYKLDGAATWTTGTSVAVSAPGDHSNDAAHTISYRSTDCFGNTEMAKSCTVKIDTTAPDGSLLLNGGAAVTAITVVSANASLTDTSGLAQMRCSIDDKATWSDWESFAAAKSLTLPAGDGAKTVWAQYRDAAGNTVELSDQITLDSSGVLDSGAPTTTANADSLWHRSAVTVTLTATDNLGGVGVVSITSTLDGSTKTALGTSTQVEVSAPVDHGNDGVHTLSYYAFDDASNSETPHSAVVKIDTTGPATTAQATSGRKGRAIALRYKITDAWSPKAIAIRIVVKNSRGTTVKAFSPTTKITATWYSVNWTPKMVGTYRYYVYGKDLAGNAQSRIGSARVVVR